jgi:GNAT superfamily N-acetyltransferase
MRTPAQLALAFALRGVGVASVLFGATTPEHVTENVGALAVSERLTQRNLASLRELAGALRSALAVIALTLLASSTGAAAAPRPVVCDRPGHDLRANPQTEPIGPGSATRKIKDGGGTHGVVSGLREADLNLAVACVCDAPTAGGCRRRDDAIRERRERASATSRAHGSPTRRTRGCSSGSMPTARPTGCERDAHALSRLPERLDERRLCKEQASGRDRAARTARVVGLSRPRPARALRLHGFNWANVPVILVEMGFMTNPTEDRLLATAAYQRRAAIGLCRGTLEFIGRATSLALTLMASFARDDPIDSSLAGIDWERAKADLAADRFDNGRSAAALQRSFEQSRHVAIARDGGLVVGMARLLSDGVCNAYLVDVWTASAHRRQGIASAMIRALLDEGPRTARGLADGRRAGPVSLIGFAPQPEFWSVVVGSWLDNDANAERTRPAEWGVYTF